MSDATQTPDEIAVHDVIDARVRAVRARDVAAVLDLYAEDVVAFDLVAPLANTGRIAVRERVVAWFDSFETDIEYELRDVALVVAGDVAFDHHLTHVRGTIKDGQATGKTIDMWFRETIGYRRVGGRWQVVHQHSSAPLDPKTMAGALELKP